MKVCIPTQDNSSIQSPVNEHFGSAPFFAIYDSESGKTEFIENTNAHHSHGMCHPIAALGENHVAAVVCGGMGARALQKLNDQGIKVYKASPGTLENLISQFENNSITELTLENACGHHGCH